jgi:hypothetical protein
MSERDYPNRQPGEPHPDDICPRCGAPDRVYCTCQGEGQLLGKVYRGFSESTDTGGPRAIFVEQPNGERYPLPVSGEHREADRNWGYGGAGPRYLAQDILADHLGTVPDRPLTMRYRSAGPARWEQGRPWQTTAAELDRFLTRPEIQELLEAQRQDDQVEWQLRELERREQNE